MDAERWAISVVGQGVRGGVATGKMPSFEQIRRRATSELRLPHGCHSAQQKTLSACMGTPHRCSIAVGL